MFPNPPQMMLEPFVADRPEADKPLKRAASEIQLINMHDQQVC